MACQHPGVGLVADAEGQATHLGAIGQFVSSKIDLAKRALANQPPEVIVAHGLEIGVIELV